MKQSNQNLLAPLDRFQIGRSQKLFATTACWNRNTIRYLLGAMDPLDSKYTEIRLDEANRVTKYLQDNTDTRFQGSDYDKHPHPLIIVISIS